MSKLTLSEFVLSKNQTHAALQPTFQKAIGFKTGEYMSKSSFMSAASRHIVTGGRTLRMPLRSIVESGHVASGGAKTLGHTIKQPKHQQSEERRRRTRENRMHSRAEEEALLNPVIDWDDDEDELINAA